jgi:hypothetical protein
MIPKGNIAMDETSDFVLDHVTTDRTEIQLREKVSGAELIFAINADGTLGECTVVPLSLPEHRSGPPIDVEDHPAVDALVAKARKAAEIFLANTP